MKNKEILAILIMFVVAIGFTVWYQNNQNNAVSEPKVCFGEDCFSVEVADDDGERTTGLMNRDSLDADSGMLFIFEDERVYPFWMKNTLIPLDMIWLNSNKEIVFIKENAVPCEQDPCFIITPSGVAKYVIELNSGIVAERNIRVGQRVEFEIE